MTELITQILFWLSLTGLAYVYLGYPLLVRVLSSVRPLRRERHPADDSQKVSVVIACYNEAERIRVKLNQLLWSQQADQIAEIVIGSDGSTDNLADVIASFRDRRIRLIEFASRRGKPAVLNDLVPRCISEVVVLCDARQILSERAIPELLANFADPSVGVVSGELMFRSSKDSSTASRGIGAYWRYEKMIRKAEARYRSVPGATGALYAIRRSLFQPIPDSTLLDDVVIPMQAVVSGSRCVFEPEAIAWDDPAASLGKEAVRKRRTIAGAAQMLLHHPSWLLPWKNPIWLEFVSHKVLRLTSPLLLMIVAIANIQLAADPFYRVLLIFHLAFYYSAFAGWLLQKGGRSSLLFGVQLMFLTLNVTTAAALWDAFRGRFRVTWQKA